MVAEFFRLILLATWPSVQKRTYASVCAAVSLCVSCQKPESCRLQKAFLEGGPK